jgi:cytoplasmic tRNA 2-thiolation protein 2
LFAQEIKIQKVVVGDNATEVAIKIISETCKGRGFSISSQVHFCDNHFLSSHGREIENCADGIGVLLIHPMKTFLSKEVAFYVHYLKLKTVNIRSLQTFASKSSIETLTQGNWNFKKLIF